ncbi:DUF397 domain-containing protein [Streptomyces sp. XM4011]|uniref:DUF397 domain-containing protein n=1 Tax=Streptomyces sp. XM4011 TaxID=2929780 RepID=UPI001FF89E29|nr:DUF397 domain-containing protein [Streptomyces sp. XM4011]MCK1814477.1 DUF397 domain-containing protein [Streptomyces sp. XM4011]
MTRHSTEGGVVGVERQPAVRWRRSSYSLKGDSQCAEVARFPGGAVGVRDSKRGDGPVLRFPRPAWTAFLTTVTG